MRFIWVRNAETGKDMAAPIDHIGGVFDDEKGTMIILQGLEFPVEHTVHEVLEKIDYVRKMTAPKGRMVRLSSDEELIFDLTTKLNMKVGLSKKDNGLVLRMTDPDSKINSSSCFMYSTDLESLYKEISKVVKPKVPKVKEKV